jgi:hypothetical protein
MLHNHLILFIMCTLSIIFQIYPHIHTTDIKSYTLANILLKITQLCRHWSTYMSVYSSILMFNLSYSLFCLCINQQLLLFLLSPISSYCCFPYHQSTVNSVSPITNQQLLLFLLSPISSYCCFSYHQSADNAVSPITNQQIMLFLLSPISS